MRTAASLPEAAIRRRADPISPATCLAYTAITLTFVGLTLLTMLYSGGYLTEGKTARQKRTVYDLRDAAQALRSFRDRHGGFPVGSWPQVSKQLLAEGFALDLPSNDVYGTPYEYRPSDVNASGLAQHFRLRSAGADRLFESTSPPGAFEPHDFDRDIVVGEVQFLQWPQRTPATGP